MWSVSPRACCPSCVLLRAVSIQSLAHFDTGLSLSLLLSSESPLNMHVPAPCWMAAKILLHSMGTTSLRPPREALCPGSCTLAGSAPGEATLSCGFSCRLVASTAHSSGLACSASLRRRHQRLTPGLHSDCQRHDQPNAALVELLIRPPLGTEQNQARPGSALSLPIWPMAAQLTDTPAATPGSQPGSLPCPFPAGNPESR